VSRATLLAVVFGVALAVAVFVALGRVPFGLGPSVPAAAAAVPTPTIDLQRAMLEQQSQESEMCGCNR
jgi:hypothetical protein